MAAVVPARQVLHESEAPGTGRGRSGGPHRGGSEPAFLSIMCRAWGIRPSPEQASPPGGICRSHLVLRMYRTRIREPDGQ